MSRRRPKRGGARPGAGRKPSRGTPGDVSRHVRLTAAEAARHDAARGEQPWAEWIREAADQRIARDTGDAS